MSVLTTLIGDGAKVVGSKLQLYVDAAAVIAVVVASIWFVHHERAIGAAQVQADDAKLVAAQTVHAEEVQSRAQTLVDQAVAAYQAAHPPANPVHVRVCRPTAGTGAVPSTPVLGFVTPSATHLPSSVGQEGDDIGPFTDQLLDHADAQVTALQAVVKAMAQEMTNARSK